jgi:L-fuconolactonase
MHLWDPRRFNYAWLGDKPQLNRQFGPSDLDTEGYDLSGVIVVEADCSDDQSLDEVVWLEMISENWPVMKAIVARLPVELGRRSIDRLNALSRHHPLVKGVRRNIETERHGFMLEHDFLAGVQTLSGYGYTFDLCIRHEQLREVIELVSRIPSVTFILDHLGKPPVAQGVLNPWRHELSQLAEHSNVHCKLSGLTTEASRTGWNSADLLPYLDHAIRLFGAERCLIGGDWPVAMAATSYGRWIDLVQEAVAGLAIADKGAIFANTAKRVYGLESPGRADSSGLSRSGVFKRPQK